MTEDKARVIANVVVGAAVLGAAVIIIRTPPLRRLAFGLARTALTVSAPAWLWGQVRQAWDDSGPQQPAGTAESVLSPVRQSEPVEMPQS